MININGHDVDFTYTSLEDAARLSLASKEIAKRIPELDKAQDDGWGETVKVTIDCYREYLRTATGVDILEGCSDVARAEEVYFEFLSEVEKQKKEYQEKRMELIQHYNDLKALT